MPDPLDLYRALRDRTDRATGRLVDLHCRHLACRPGCHDCCADLTVSPVEYHAILADLRTAGVTGAMLPVPEGSAGCAFLTADGLCGLYRFRPLICRTHGLPVAFAADEGGGPDDPPAMSVSFCPKNFTGAGPDDLAFGPDNTLGLDALNAELAALNAEFLHSDGPPSPSPAPHRRIPLRQLRADL